MAAQCATESLDNPLWQFAQRFYQMNNVEQRLLEIQEDGGDVLLVLAALWLASEWRAWPEGEPFAQRLAGYLGWRDSVIRPLRGIRTLLPKGSLSTAPTNDRFAGEFRQRVKALELEAEQFGLAGLYQLLEEFAGACPEEESLVDCVMENLALLPDWPQPDRDDDSPEPLIDALEAYLEQQS
ncbi:MULTISPECIES: TIGR02444 family protein [unclassified Oceanobacter]|uniref:TIGR02444 family protein n=1 Tax=unclassified Oceanobacter TaxID=2620260 RepID=UPI002734649C|nr:MULTISPECIES: TIGR02444 family protein [unclassified Oceanobacter]MDP2607843.1 TIGR02444 family protein [Oceanobacter sp. 1_MG-2023]MDP2610973.1 TIGR02444 family protein [Oceanobacter sp. 2_MG-2023]